MDKDIERRNNIEYQLDKLGCNNYRRLSANYTPGLGELGCALSHKRSIQTAKQNQWRNVLIFEDDFDFGVYANDKINMTHIKHTINEALKCLNNDYDVLFLSNYPFIEMNPNPSDMHEMSASCVGSHNIVKREIIGAATTAYLVNERFYDQLMESYSSSIQGLQPLLHSEDSLIRNILRKVHAIDIQWFKLMLNPFHKWYVMNPIIGNQNRDEFKSNIDKAGTIQGYLSDTLQSLASMLYGTNN